MKLSRFAFALAALAITGAGAWLFVKSGPAIVPLPDGQRMRILKVSLGSTHVFSFEPLWKQVLRRGLPGALEKTLLAPFQGKYLYTPGDNLVVWVDGAAAGTSLKTASAVFTNDLIPGKAMEVKSGLYSLSFRCFQRESGIVPLRVRYQGQEITFTVKNPHPAQASNWAGLPLPQTQQAGRASVNLTRLVSRTASSSSAAECEAFLHVRGPGVGWNWWRITAFDPWGNYQVGDFNSHSVARFPPLPKGRGTWRLKAKGQEFLSVGRIPYPVNESFIVLPLKERLQDLGIKLLLLVNVGNYTFTNGPNMVSVQSVSTPVPTDCVTVSKAASSINWAVNLKVQLPGVLCVSDLVPDLPRPGMRIHERDERNEGRTYGCKSFSATNDLGGVKQLAQFFVLPPIPADGPSQPELELVSELGAEFFVKDPDNRTE